MKILITYASAGAGHRKAAEALHDYIKANDPNADVTLIDILVHANPIYRFFYTWGYSFLINHGKWLWHLAFYLTYARKLRKSLRAGARVVDRISSNSFILFLREKNPDYIISTHFLASECATFVKRAGAINSRLLTVITDFGVHPFWVSKGTDIYVVASEATKNRLMRLGVEADKIRVLGIPVHPAFTRTYDKTEVRKRLGLQVDRFTVLMVTGSFGVGPLAGITDDLAGEVQLIVVCANNTALYQKLKRAKYPNVLVLGFVDNMAELMAASDLIITKPGGLTIAEVLASELTPLFISPIPGQETENIKVLKEYGIGASVPTTEILRRTVRDYKRHPLKLDAGLEYIRALRKTAAAQEIYDVIRAGCTGDRG